eukprot:392902_1
MTDKIKLNVEQLMVLSKEYETKFSFQYVNVHNINNAIKSILESVIEDYLHLDIAFVQIYQLIIFATNNINDSFQFISYYKFLVHFLIFGCCLNSKYRKFMVLNENDKHYRYSQLLRYCVHQFIPNVTPKHIKYAQCNKYRNSINNSLLKYVNNMNANVATLIADFVQFRCDEFFVTLSVFFKSWQATREKGGNKIFNTNFIELWSFYGFDPTAVNHDAFLPKLLFSKQFIMIPKKDNYKLHDDLDFFGETVFLKLSREGVIELNGLSKGVSSFIWYSVIIMCVSYFVINAYVICIFFF